MKNPKMILDVITGKGDLDLVIFRLPVMKYQVGFKVECWYI